MPRGARQPAPASFRREAGVIRIVTGRHNASLKLVRKLQKKKYQSERNCFVGEGWDVFESALSAGVRPLELLVREDLRHRLPPDVMSAAETGALDIVICPPDILAEASLLGGSADVIAVFGERLASLRDWDMAAGVTLYLYGVGDPGNVGTLIRSAMVFGAAGVACSPRTADPFGPRALRAGMGAHFSVPVATEVEPDDLVAYVEGRASKGEEVPLLLLADPRGQITIREAAARLAAVEAPEEKPVSGRPTGRGVLVVLGSERGELPHLNGWPGEAAVPVAVPQVRFDSLNVAMAGTIFLYELAVSAQCA